MIVIGKPGLYVSKLDLEEGVIHFTEKRKEALRYSDSWKPGVELDMLRHNFNDEYGEQLKDMRVREINPDYPESEDDYDYPQPEAEGDDVAEGDDLPAEMGENLDDGFFAALMGLTLDSV